MYTEMMMFIVQITNSSDDDDYDAMMGVGGYARGVYAWSYDHSSKMQTRDQIVINDSDYCGNYDIKYDLT